VCGRCARRLRIFWSSTLRQTGFLFPPFRIRKNSVRTGHKQSRHRAVRLRKHPDCFVGVRSVTAQEPESVLQTELVLGRSSPGMFPHCPRTCSERNSAGDCPAFCRAANAPGVATTLPRETAVFVRLHISHQLLLKDLVFAFPAPRRAVQKKQMPFLAVATAPSRSRRQGRTVCVHWSKAKALDGGSRARSLGEPRTRPFSFVALGQPMGRPCCGSV
jgi:hypothetical protein